MVIKLNDPKEEIKGVVQYAKEFGIKKGAIWKGI